MTDFHLFVIITAALLAKEILTVAFKSVIVNAFHRMDAESKRSQFIQMQKPPMPSTEGKTTVTRRPNASEL